MHQREHRKHAVKSLFHRIPRIFYHFSPLMNGTRQRRITIPTIPIIIPTTIWLHTIVRHIPTPKSSAPAIPISVALIVFPDSLIGSLFSIFLHTSTIISSTIAPTTLTVVLSALSLSANGMKAEGLLYELQTCGLSISSGEAVELYKDGDYTDGLMTEHLKNCYSLENCLIPALMSCVTFPCFLPPAY